MRWIIGVFKFILLLLCVIFGWIYWCPLVTKVFVTILGFHGTVEGLDKLDTYKNGIMVFNHPTLFEVPILLAALERPLSFVAKKATYPSVLKRIGKRLHTIVIDPNVATTKVIASALQHNLVAMAPMEGKCLEDQTKLADFRTGAFIHDIPILPVVIHYTPYERWVKEKSLKSEFIKRLLGKPIRYRIKILDPIESKGQDPKHVASICKAAMEKALCQLEEDAKLDEKLEYKSTMRVPLLLLICLCIHLLLCIYHVRCML